MIMRAYTIHDVKGLNYGSPWFQHTDGAAVRVLQDLVNDPNTTVGRHPRDYSLWLCGTWDDATGVFNHLAPLVHVMDAANLVERQPELPLAPAPLSPADSAAALSNAIKGAR